MDLTKFKRSSSYAAIVTRHYSILTSILYRVRTLMSRNAEESENTPESPHLGEIKRMSKQCVPGAPLFFVRTGDEARVYLDHITPYQALISSITKLPSRWIAELL